MKTGTIRKTFFLLILILCMLQCSAAALASAKSVYKKGVRCYKKDQFTRAEKYFKKLPEHANEKCVKSMSSSMKKAYRKIVRRYDLNSLMGPNTLFGYYLTDIDKDKKPELLVTYLEAASDSSRRTLVYTFKKKKAVKIGDFYSWSMGFYYDPRGNGLVVRFARQGWEEIYGMKLTGGKLVETAKWGKGRLEDLENRGYTWLPYVLDNHISYLTKNGTSVRKVDLKPLK